MAKAVKTTTKKTLADTLAGELGMTKKAAAEAVNVIFDEMAETLKDGGTVDVNGFGKFTVKTRQGRKGVNPRTVEELGIKASKVPGFKASKTLKDLVK